MASAEAREARGKPRVERQVAARTLRVPHHFCPAEIGGTFRVAARHLACVLLTQLRHSKGVAAALLKATRGVRSAQAFSASVRVAPAQAVQEGVE
jgi:hypothetical protein